MIILVLPVIVLALIVLSRREAFFIGMKEMRG